MPDYSAQLASAIDDSSSRIGIIGLGYVGLPLIDAFAIAGFRTLGFDTDQRKIDQLQAGESYIGHIAATRIAELVNGQYLVPTADMTRLSEADVLLICVPTPLSDSRDPISPMSKLQEGLFRRTCGQDN